jgi:hypothetical protein
MAPARKLARAALWKTHFFIEFWLEQDAPFEVDEIAGVFA